MTPRSEQFLEAVSKAPLLAHVGEPLSAPPPTAADVVVVGSWAQAFESRRAEGWGKVQLVARGDLTSFLAHQHMDRYKKWNELTRSIKPRVLELATPVCQATAQREKLSSSLLASVSWDLLAACMEYEFADLRPPGFYDRLASLYLLGRFPCGWQGEYPSGRLEMF